MSSQGAEMEKITWRYSARYPYGGVVKDFACPQCGYPLGPLKLRGIKFCLACRMVWQREAGILIRRTFAEWFSEFVAYVFIGFGLVFAWGLDVHWSFPLVGMFLIVLGLNLLRYSDGEGQR